MQSKKHWSKPIVLFHWGLMIGVLGLFVSAEFSNMKAHQFFGYFLACLLVWRVVYSFKAPSHEKLSSWLHSPKKILLFFVHFFSHKEDEKHNPASASMMIVLLALITLLLITGSFGFAYMEESGLVSYVVAGNYDLGERLLDAHEGMSEVLLVLIGLHAVGALLSSLVTKTNLFKTILFFKKRS